MESVGRRLRKSAVERSVEISLHDIALSCSSNFMISSPTSVFRVDMSKASVSVVTSENTQNVIQDKFCKVELGLRTVH